jgi:hypothetical protein
MSDTPESNSEQSRRPGNPAWKPGVSGNPTGRARGSRNKSALIMEALLDGDAEAIGRTAVNLAKHGNIAALRLCMARLIPPRRERAVAFELPPIDCAADAAKASAALLQAVAAGELSPTEAGELGRLVEIASRAFVAAEKG